MLCWKQPGVVETMKKLPGKKPKNLNLIPTVSLSYLALLVLLMIAPIKSSDANLAGNNSSVKTLTSLPELISVGRGEMRWFGFLIYEATLSTSSGLFHTVDKSLPIALTLLYDKNISSEALAQRTLEEWEHLGKFNRETRQLWKQRLEQIWPNVKPGDKITTLVSKNNKTAFFHNNTLISVLDDPKFGTAFLSIWLDPNTSEPELRKKLIGKQEIDQ